MFSSSQNSKCLDLPKFNMGGGGGREGCSGSQIPMCQDLPKFQFLGGGGGGVLEVKSQSAKICLNLNFQVGGVVLNQIPEQGVVRNFSTHFALPLSGSLCITDSLSHITYVETNKMYCVYVTWSSGILVNNY